MAWLFNLVIDVFNLVILTQMTKLKVDAYERAMPESVRIMTHMV
jgi:hypothetical protein